ncbi:MAG: ABC transporter ATP-binding protein [Deltaproteobacteria bacterium]|nr:ABC transporter ATP-binding protein [Deltaproteobacteria bacterium]
MKGETWFRAQSLRVFYERVEALKGISIEVESGAIVALIGANGAGKSTTLRAISGLIGVASGEIFFEGRRIDGLSPQEIVRTGIAHVPEGRRVFPYMTVKENLMMGAFRRKDREGIQGDLEGVFEHFPVLKERRSQSAGSLSGGEQQMLAIGRALMSKPRLLLLDEPSLGLAPLMVREVGRVISDINQRKVGIILVEQNAQMALRLAHKGYVLETGSIALQGKASELIDNEHVRKAYLGG